jgi:hypothetical protein
MFLPVASATPSSGAYDAPDCLEREKKSPLNATTASNPSASEGQAAGRASDGNGGRVIHAIGTGD